MQKLSMLRQRIAANLDVVFANCQPAGVETQLHSEPCPNPKPNPTSNPNPDPDLNPCLNPKPKPIPNPSPSSTLIVTLTGCKWDQSPHLQDVRGEGGLQQFAALHGLHHGLLRDRRQQPVGVQAQAPVRGAPLRLADEGNDQEFDSCQWRLLRIVQHGDRDDLVRIARL